MDMSEEEPVVLDHYERSNSEGAEETAIQKLDSTKAASPGLIDAEQNGSYFTESNRMNYLAK
jgi:hypothetical protein